MPTLFLQVMSPFLHVSITVARAASHHSIIIISSTLGLHM